MARLTKAQREWRPGMPKKRRSTKIMFASTVLLLEAFVAFFATLAVFGLRRGEIPPVLISRRRHRAERGPDPRLRRPVKPWGMALGWILQLVLILLGIVEPTMFLVGALFALCLVVRHPDRHPDRRGGRPTGPRTGRMGRRASGRRRQGQAPPRTP